MKTVHFAVVKWSKDGKKNCPGCDYYSLTCFVKLRPKDFYADCVESSSVLMNVNLENLFPWLYRLMHHFRAFLS